MVASRGWAAADHEKLDNADALSKFIIVIIPIPITTTNITPANANFLLFIILKLIGSNNIFRLGTFIRLIKSDFSIQKRNWKIIQSLSHLNIDYNSYRNSLV
jgi:hypothetical protein